MQAPTYTKVSNYEGRKGEVKKVVLLYSGGLNTSVMLKWIQEEYGAQVVALTIDIGQQADDLEEIRKKHSNLELSKPSSSTPKMNSPTTILPRESRQMPVIKANIT